MQYTQSKDFFVLQAKRSALFG